MGLNVPAGNEIQLQPKNESSSDGQKWVREQDVGNGWFPLKNPNSGKILSAINDSSLVARGKYKSVMWVGGWMGLSDYSELSNKHGAHLILFEKKILPASLIRTYIFIYFCGKLPPTWLLEPPYLFIFKKNPGYSYSYQKRSKFYLHLRLIDFWKKSYPHSYWNLHLYFWIFSYLHD